MAENGEQGVAVRAFRLNEACTSMTFTLLEIKLGQNVQLLGRCPGNCGVCPLNRDPLNGIPVNQMASCATKNLIYHFECKICHMQYVGQTGGTLKKRMQNHKTDRRKEADAMRIHFENHHPEGPADFSNWKMSVLQLITEGEAARNYWESWWKMTLRTYVHVGGLNRQ